VLKRGSQHRETRVDLRRYQAANVERQRLVRIPPLGMRQTYPRLNASGTRTSGPKVGANDEVGAMILRGTHLTLPRPLDRPITAKLGFMITPPFGTRAGPTRTRLLAINRGFYSRRIAATRMNALHGEPVCGF